MPVFSYLRLVMVIMLLLVKVLSTASERTMDPTQGEIANDKVYELVDANFEHFISRTEYKWLVLFYLNTCAHCARAKKEITSIYQTVLDSTVRFAEIEIQANVMTSIRFNSTQVPYIVLFQNGKMFEFTKYPNAKNLNEFINIDKVEEDALPIPKPVKFFYVAWVMMRDGVKSFKMTLERYLKAKGYNVKIESWHLITVALIGLALIGLFEYWCISRCCAVDDFEKYVQQQELEMKLREEREANQEGGEEGEPQGEAMKGDNDEERMKKEAEAAKEKEKASSAKKKKEKKKDEGNKKNVKKN